jgi:hypothetical protein
MSPIGNCLLITILPTVVILAIPLLFSRTAIPLTSLIANLLSNTVMGVLIFGIYSVTQESRSPFQDGSWLALGMFVTLIVIYVVFHYRIVDLPLRSEKDSIAYVPSLTRHEFFDVYNLSELVMKFLCNPPMIIVKSESFHIDPRTGERIVTFLAEKEIEYGSWRDLSVLPVQFPRRYLVEFKLSMEYLALPPELEQRIAGEEAAAAAQPHDAQVQVTREIMTPGFASRVFATTRGEIPGFIAFMTSNVGEKWRKFLLFIGYHSILEALWLLLFSTEELTFRKELSATEDWTPAGEVALMDYHCWPEVL